MRWQWWAIAVVVFAVVACGGREEGPLETLVRETPIPGPISEFDFGESVELVSGVDLIIDDVSWQLSISRVAPGPAYSPELIDRLGGRSTTPIRYTRSPQVDGDLFMIVAYKVINGSQESIDPSLIPALIHVENDSGRRSIARHFNPDAPLPFYGTQDTLFDVPTLGRLDPGQTGNGLLVFETRPAPDLIFRSDIVGFTMEIPVLLSLESLSSSAEQK